MSWAFPFTHLHFTIPNIPVGNEMTKLIKQEYMVDFYKDFKAIFLLNNWKFWGYQNSSLSLTPV